MKRLTRMLLQRGWAAVRRIAPPIAARVDRRRRSRIRAAAAVAGAVQFEERLANLERELELVSKQLAVVTMRLEHPSAPRDPSDPPGATARDEEARLISARMSAIAFYEERISRLEGAAGLVVAPAADVPSSADNPR